MAMNRETAAEDIKTLSPNGVCLYPEEWQIQQDRDDITYYAMPVKALD